MKGENKSGATRKILIFDSFFIVFYFRFLNIVCPNQIQKSCSFYREKKCKV